MKMSMALVLASGASLALAAAASAGLSQSLAGPGLQTFSNGGGGGFGGTLGAGSISMQIVGSDLVIGFNPGNAVNDYVALFLDTKAGGQTDASMGDGADDGRRSLSNLTRDLNDVFPNMPSGPDFGGVFWNGGGGNQAVGFELQSGGDGSHIYAGNYVNNGGGAYTLTFSLAQLGNPSEINFFAAYVSGGGYGSNESLPASPGLNGNGNPGFGDGQFGGLNPPPAEIVYENYNQYTVPAPAAAALLGLGGLAAGRRRRA